MIQYASHLITAADSEAVARVLASDRLTQGPEVAAFEDAFAKRVGAPYAVAFSSGTAALHGAVYVAGLSPVHKLITSALTFVASANAALYCGGWPLFADIGPDWNVTAETVAMAAERSNLVEQIVPVHFAGLPCDVAGIRERFPDTAIVEDAAHALGSPGVGSCEHSDFTCFSLHPSKAITAGEGGMVTCRTKDNVKQLRRFRNHGFDFYGDWHREQVELGYNYRLSEIHAALGRSQLAKLDEFIERRREIAAVYRSGLSDKYELPPEHPDHSYHLFVVRHEERKRIYRALKDKGIQTEVHYLPVNRNLAHDHDSVAYLPEVAAYYDRCLSLPIHPALSDDDVQTVIDEANRIA